MRLLLVTKCHVGLYNNIYSSERPWLFLLCWRSNCYWIFFSRWYNLL